MSTPAPESPTPAAPRRRTRKPAAERRAEILDAALEIADLRGPEGLTTARLARRVALSEAAIFRHFATKADLWRAVVGLLRRRAETAWTDAVASEPAPADRLRAIALAQLRLVAATPAIPSILLSRELHVKNDALREALLDMLMSFHTRLADTAADALAAGAFRPGLSPRDAAFAVIGSIQGVIVRWSLNGRRFDLVDEGARLLDLVLAGFAARPAGGRP